jgi:hypothetical protein
MLELPRRSQPEQQQMLRKKRTHVSTGRTNAVPVPGLPCEMASGFQRQGSAVMTRVVFTRGPHPNTKRKTSPSPGPNEETSRDNLSVDWRITDGFTRIQFYNGDVYEWDSISSDLMGLCGLNLGAVYFDITSAIVWLKNWNRFIRPVIGESYLTKFSGTPPGGVEINLNAF